MTLINQTSNENFCIFKIATQMHSIDRLVCCGR